MLGIRVFAVLFVGGFAGKAIAGIVVPFPTSVACAKKMEARREEEPIEIPRAFETPVHARLRLHLEEGTQGTVGMIAQDSTELSILNDLHPGTANWTRVSMDDSGVLRRIVDRAFGPPPPSLQPEWAAVSASQNCVVYKQKYEHQRLRVATLSPGQVSETRQIPLGKDFARAFAVSPQGDWIAVLLDPSLPYAHGERQGRLRLWNVRNHRWLENFEHPVTLMRFGLPDETFLEFSPQVSEHSPLTLVFATDALHTRQILHHVQRQFQIYELDKNGAHKVASFSAPKGHTFLAPLGDRMAVIRGKERGLPHTEILWIDTRTSVVHNSTLTFGYHVEEKPAVAFSSDGRLMGFWNPYGRLFVIEPEHRRVLSVRSTEKHYPDLWKVYSAASLQFDPNSSDLYTLAPEGPLLKWSMTP